MEHLRMADSCVYLWILGSFSEHLSYRAPLRSCLFHIQVAESQPIDTTKNYFAGASQAFYTRARSSYSKALICEEVNLWCKPAIFPSCILPSFSQNASWLLLPKRLWKCASTISFKNYKWKIVLLVINLFNYDSSKSTFFMLSMAFDVILSTGFFVFFFNFIFQIKWNSSFLAIQRLQEHACFCSTCVFWYILFYKNLTVLHHGDNTFLLFFYICVKWYF